MELNPNAEQGISTENAWRTVLSSPWENLTSHNPNIEKRPDFIDLQQWYDTQTGLLPKFEVTDSSLEDAAWNSVFSILPETKGKVLEIKRFDNEFYKIVGAHCIKTDPTTGKIIFEWNQPVLLYKEKPLNVTMFGKEVNLPIFGLLAVIKDSNGNLLMTIDQEVTSENKNRSLIRLPIQASSGKIAQMVAGNLYADKNLADLMQIYDCSSFDQLLNTAEEILPIAPEDTNRDLKHNIALLMPKIEYGSKLHKKLVSDGKRKWLTQEQWDMVVLARLTNSHTAACVNLSEKSERLKRL